MVYTIKTLFIGLTRVLPHSICLEYHVVTLCDSFGIHTEVHKHTLCGR